MDTVHDARAPAQGGNPTTRMQASNAGTRYIARRHDCIYWDELVVPAIELESVVGIVAFAVFVTAGETNHTSWLRRNRMVLVCFGRSVISRVRELCRDTRVHIPDAWKCCVCTAVRPLDQWQCSWRRYGCNCGSPSHACGKCESCFNLEEQAAASVDHYEQWLEREQGYRSD